MKMSSLTAERVRELLIYDPLTGIFLNRVTRSNRAKAGAVAGSLHTSSGYWRINLDGEKHYGHRLAWIYMTGEWPPHGVDHEDTNTSNNTWENLRPATQTQNSQNSNLRSDSTTGVKGVAWYAARSKYIAYITLEGAQRHIGYFDTIPEAAAAYATAAKIYFGEFARPTVVVEPEAGRRPGA